MLEKNKKIMTQVYAFLAFIVIAMPMVANNYVMNTFSDVFFYVVVCLGLNIVVGYAGLLDLGYAAFFAVGAYTTAILTSSFGMNFWLTIPFAILFSALSGVIIGGPTLRLRSDYLAIVTLGFGEIVRITARNLKITGGSGGIYGIERPSFFGIEMSGNIHYYYAFLVLAFFRIDFRIRAFQVNRRQYARRAMAGTREEDGVDILIDDQPVQVRIGERQGRTRAPVPEQTFLDMFRRQWFT